MGGAWRQTVLLALATLVHVALAPVAFALAVLSPTWFEIGGAGLGWAMALLSFSFLLAVIAAPFAAWAAYAMRRAKLAWIAAGAPLLWGLGFGLAYVFIAGL